MLRLDVFVPQQYVLPGHTYFTAACAAAARWTCLFCKHTLLFLGRVCLLNTLQPSVPNLDVSVLSQPVLRLELDVSVLQQHVLPLYMSVSTAVSAVRGRVCSIAVCGFKDI